MTHHHVPADLPDRIQHYIDGEFTDSVDGDTFDVLDPVTNEVYVRAAAGKKADIERAVAAAIADGFRTGDIATGRDSETRVGTTAMGDAILARI